MTIVRVASLFVALHIAIAAGGASAAERAAAIEYEFVARPARVPADYATPAGTTLRFLSIKALDDFKVEAALWHPAGRPADTTPLIISVHGSRGTFHADPIAFLSKALASKGYGVLGINTRAGQQINTDNFLDVRRDLEAAAYTARALGYRNLVLHGQALGSIHVQFYAATNWEKDIKAVVLTGMFGSLPWKSRHVLVQDEQNWRELIATSMQALRDAKSEQVMPVQMAWITGEKVSISSRHFLTYRLEDTSAADGTYWIRRVPYPILMVRDEGDTIIQSFEPYMLLSAATSTGSLVPAIKYVVLPNTTRGPAEHRFVNNRGPLVDAVVAWLGERGLR